MLPSNNAPFGCSTLARKRPRVALARRFGMPGIQMGFLAEYSTGYANSTDQGLPGPAGRPAAGRPCLPSLSIVVGLSSLAHEHHEELEQVHEADVEAERAEDGDLLGHFRAPRLGILRLDPLGVIGDQFCFE